MTHAVEPFIRTQEDGTHQLHLLVSGLQCAGCVAIIERMLAKMEGIVQARLTLSTRRLLLTWRGNKTQATDYLQALTARGYNATAFHPQTQKNSEQHELSFLLRCLAVAGFASGNLMLFSIPLWSSDAVEMGQATRTLFHWLQAGIALPAVCYAGRPFFRSALVALRNRRTNMDVPISVAVILACLMSLYETITHGVHSYFDSAVMLLFFLLIGRYLEARARGQARSAASDLLHMMNGTATIQTPNGIMMIALSELQPGMLMRIAAGEKIGADGVVIEGSASIDTSLITGESLPKSVEIGDDVFAGTTSLDGSLMVRVTKPHQRSVLAEIIALMETAEQSQSHYVTLADRISRWYTPLVHVLALATFLAWYFLGGIAWQVALLYAATVLIITCPCALGLAVPVVQMIACGTLMRRGILLKSASALERLASITDIVFDKTGTLTLGKPVLQNGAFDDAALQCAASIAAHSKHPLSQALVRACPNMTTVADVKEVAGCGLEAGDTRLGKRGWALLHEKDAPPTHQDGRMELWLTKRGHAPVRFTFTDTIRPDAAETISALQHEGLHTHIFSGDRMDITQKIAATLAIPDAAGDLSPLEKTNRIHALMQTGARVLMVGDGLNDAPSLASATVSMSPSSAADITQNAADIVFQGDRLAPVADAWHTARKTQQLVKENFALAAGYNIFAIPLAVTGYVTPLIAAIAMSASSLIVIANALRLTMERPRP